MRQHVFKKGDAEFGIVEGRPTIRGECDLSNAADIEGWLISFGEAPIDVDLSGVTFFGASALRALINVAKCNPNTAWSSRVPRSDACSRSLRQHAF